MSPLKIDVFAPPFDGHLNPILGLARILQEFGDVRVLTTPDAIARVAAAGFQTFPILQQQVTDVWRIANTPGPVRGRPWMLLRQFRENLRLMPPLRKDVESAWHARTPDLALVDFTLPAIGAWARARGIRWWTSHPSPLAIETLDGTPTYLGGWAPRPSWFGRRRDALGRAVVRGFKRAIFAGFTRDLRRAGLNQLYRTDGTEMAYSDEVILALGSPELEFPGTWPNAVRFIGPVTYTPKGHVSSPLRLDPVRKNVLVTIGTHLPYARRQMAKHLKTWAGELRDVFFHYTTGGDEALTGNEGENWRVYRYINYEQYIGQFAAVVHHGGAGIAYHCLEAGLPAVVWPQDYDQFDLAARLSHHGLAVRSRNAAAIPRSLRHVLGDKSMHRRSEAFAQHLRKFDQRDCLIRVFREQGLAPCTH